MRGVLLDAPSSPKKRHKVHHRGRERERRGGAQQHQQHRLGSAYLNAHRRDHWGPPPSSSPSPSPTVDVFYRTFSRDVEMLGVSMRSVDKYGGRTVFRSIVVCYPRADDDAFVALVKQVGPSISLPVRLSPVNSDERGLPFFYDLAHADTHSDADVVAHMDADMIMHHPISRQDLLAPDGKPILRASHFDMHDGVIREANKPSQDLIGMNTNHTTLGRQVYPRKVRRGRGGHSWHRTLKSYKPRGGYHTSNTLHWAGLIIV